MTIHCYVYFALSLALLAVLSLILIRLGRLLMACPDTDMRVPVVVTSLITGFATLGGGAIVLTALLISWFSQGAIESAILAFGVICLILGFGFTQAVSVLRGLVEPVPEAAAKAPSQVGTAV